MTVYRISNKIRPSKRNSAKNQTEKNDLVKCKFCLGFLDNESVKNGANAGNDLKFSQNLSLGKFGAPGSLIEAGHIPTLSDSSTSPAELQLCYSCTLLMKDLKLNPSESAQLFEALPSSNRSLCTEEQMKEKLQGVLLED